MKKILIIFSIILSFTSCKSDLLDTYPYDKAGSENMWTTESLADQGVVGIYETLRQPMIAGKIDQLEAFGVSGNNVWLWGWINWMTNQVSASEGMFANYWKQHYEMISRANDAIANLNKAPLSEEKYNRLMSESKFLRAYAYYRLNMVFDGVPVYLEPTKAEDFTKARETAASVWQTVVADLTDCINDNNFPARYEASNTLYGRTTKGAAYALRGKVYLWLKEWAKAESDFRKVGEAGYSLFQGEFGDLFTEENERCPEMIFSFQCIRTIGLGNNVSRYYGSHITHGWCIADCAPNTDFVNSYEWADGRPFDWEDVLPDYNSMTPKQRVVYFFRNNMTEAEKTAAAAAGADMSRYLPTGNEERILRVYTNRDKRMNGSVITPYSTFEGGVAGTPNTYTMRWPYRGYGAPNFDIESNTKTSFYYLYRKFVGVGVDPYINRDNSPIDIPLIRYADVLLGLAEALNEQGKTGEALPFINEVRERAGKLALKSGGSGPVNVSDQADLRNRIRQEFRWEFCGEAISYFEEIRCGTYKEAKFFPGAALKNIEGSQGRSATGQKFVWGDRMMRWPIPPVERERNPNLTQNIGWEN
ncbi:RagB/SusD family nutrient uptake outer membrane protein [Bacteroides sp. 51]|uniref:RagB/SusD family nutrient uptake outer membrane protein n=1 Tax=Bacteroides sp. 51 TaxID=2302938 RepID=UPI0013D5A385|nr:RagB/SusD family nutrient uptake outer membrane protein [Bacteroides sp. 51]NDV81201.1 RagB/SusD family nutrient uptake outer membrane protein [Bacteroides sp. 51]